MSRSKKEIKIAEKPRILGNTEITYLYLLSNSNETFCFESFDGHLELFRLVMNKRLINNHLACN